MTVTLTPEVLADLRKKAEAAAPGPWFWVGGVLKSALEAAWGHEVVLDPGNCAYPAKTPGDAMGACGKITEARASASAEHIAAANPAVVLALLDRIEALEKDRADAVDGMKQARDALARVNAGLQRLRAMDADDLEALRNGGDR